MAGVVGFRVFTKVKRAAPEQVERFRDLPVCNIVDTMNKIAAAHSGLKPFGPVKLLGTAVTVKAPIGDNLMFHHALDLAQAGDVIVVDGGGCTERAVCGENMMQMARKKGIRGFLIDGSIRDSDAIAGFDDFAVFARAVMPNASFKGLGPGELNVPVSVGGMVVYPGDIIVGDCDGVVAIRPQHADAVAAAAEELCRKEAEGLKKILAGTMDHSWVVKALEEKGCTVLDMAWDEE